MKNKNFYNNKLTAKRYFNIVKNYKKPFSKTFILKNFGLFIGDKAFFKILKCFELIEQVKNIKGDVVEFGVWNGNNLITLKKIFDYFKIKKNILKQTNNLHAPFGKAPAFVGSNPASPAKNLTKNSVKSVLDTLWIHLRIYF